jgi:hypothetical protein
MPRLTPDWSLAEELLAEWGEAAPAEAAWWARRHEADGIVTAARRWREVEAICLVLLSLRGGAAEVDDDVAPLRRRIASA